MSDPLHRKHLVKLGLTRRRSFLAHTIQGRLVGLEGPYILRLHSAEGTLVCGRADAGYDSAGWEFQTRK